ncbi:MAG TPA: SAM-dependent methyltransferase [Planctomycetota bacterium]|nr:SAM-dependent methyltransferase [Planctomycetota bacterium]
MFPLAEFPDYALIDSGGGEKLERFGDLVLRRPDPQALWRPHRETSVWNAADLSFERDPESGGKRGTWRARPGAPAQARASEPRWQIGWRGLLCVIQPTPFKHVGIFPEQATNWDLIERAGACFAGSKPALLNLFGYTGTASLVAARAGFAVTHVDASKTSLAWLRENQTASGLPPDSLRIVLDDALAFARREVRRRARYAAILLDPPHFGRGPKNEVWQFEEHLAPLLEACRALLDERAFLVLSSYAIGFSPLAFLNLLSEFEGGRAVSDELALAEQRESGAPRYLPAGFCARFVRGIDLEIER